MNLLTRHLCIGTITALWWIGSLCLCAQSACTVDVSHPGAAVADICRGQQLEEFNHQFQGGLYAQLISNPSFEELRDPSAEWYLVQTGASNADLHPQTSSETKMLNDRQRHCMKLEVTSVASGSVGLANGGYWGIALKNKTAYRISFWAKIGDNFNGTVTAKLESNSGTVYAQSEAFRPNADWRNFSCELTTVGLSKETGDNRLVLYVSTPGDVYFDVVTAMPPTWRNRPNGLRPDLAEKMAALKLKYIQFPGGCTAESSSMEVSWNWKNSIGPIEQRPGATRDMWGYKNELYFGLDEYLQLCEDLGAKAVYTTSSGINENPRDGRYSVCPLDKMQPIISDILDLLEYCKGTTTTRWGAKRAANGHSAPYNLNYIEIGNENGWLTTEEYGPRYSMIRSAVLARYPDIKIMFNGMQQDNEPSNTRGNQADYVDEHFYLNDLSSYYSKYDSINPSCKKICIAEYASSKRGNPGDVIGSFGDTLCDAAFMLGCEKNSERIWWTGYGNYAGVVDHGNFGPCLVWNDAVSCFCTPSYYMQQMLFSHNQGTRILPFTVTATHCFWSASVDEKIGKTDMIVKVVNNSGVSETVDMIIQGTRRIDPVGKITILTAAPEAENSLAKPDNVVPTTETFVPGNRFTYSCPAYSIVVMRIGYSK